MRRLPFFFFISLLGVFSVIFGADAAYAKTAIVSFSSKLATTHLDPNGVSAGDAKQSVVESVTVSEVPDWGFSLLAMVTTVCDRSLVGCYPRAL
jgi:hypothetical protein